MELFGDQLAEVAQGHARRLDPERLGLHTSVIQDAVQAAGTSIRGDAPVTLWNAMNKAQHRFTKTGRSTWTWKETEPKDGLSGAALLEEAYLVAKRLDPDRKGAHYEAIKAAILDDGARIAGGNPGNTLFSVLKNAKDWFEPAGDGRFRWR